MPIRGRKRRRAPIFPTCAATTPSPFFHPQWPRSQAPSRLLPRAAPRPPTAYLWRRQQGSGRAQPRHAGPLAAPAALCRALASPRRAGKAVAAAMPTRPAPQTVARASRHATTSRGRPPHHRHRAATIAKPATAAGTTPAYCCSLRPVVTQPLCALVVHDCTSLTKPMPATDDDCASLGILANTGVLGHRLQHMESTPVCGTALEPLLR